MTLVPDLLSQLGIELRVRPRRGRPLRDPLEALRACIWYWHVKVVSGLTDYQLNARFAKEIGKNREEIPKVFERIRRDGVVPQDVPGSGLIDRVDADDSCRGTAWIFRSNFWELLKDPDLSIQRLKIQITEQSRLLGVGRITSSEAWGKGIKPGHGRTIDSPVDYQRGVSMLTEFGSLESATLLGLLYKEAIAFGEPELATQLKFGFMSTMVSYVERLQKYSDLPSIARHASEYNRDIHYFREFAINRVIFTGREESMLGDHGEVHHPFFRLSEASREESSD